MLVSSIAEGVRPYANSEKILSPIARGGVFFEFGKKLKQLGKGGEEPNHASSSKRLSVDFIGVLILPSHSRGEGETQTRVARA